MQIFHLKLFQLRQVQAKEEAEDWDLAFFFVVSRPLLRKAAAAAVWLPVRSSQFSVLSCRFRSRSRSRQLQLQVD